MSYANVIVTRSSAPSHEAVHECSPFRCRGHGDKAPQQRKPGT